MLRITIDIDESIEVHDHILQQNVIRGPCEIKTASKGRAKDSSFTMVRTSGNGLFWLLKGKRPVASFLAAMGRKQKSSKF